MREFCKPLPFDKKFYEEWNKSPRIEFWFNCQLDCYIYEDGVLVGIERKSGKYIDKRNPNTISSS